MMWKPGRDTRGFSFSYCLHSPTQTDPKKRKIKHNNNFRTEKGENQEEDGFRKSVLRCVSFRSSLDRPPQYLLIPVNRSQSENRIRPHFPSILQSQTIHHTAYAIFTTKRKERNEENEKIYWEKRHSHWTTNEKTALSDPIFAYCFCNLRQTFNNAVEIGKK